MVGHSASAVANLGNRNPSGAQASRNSPDGAVPLATGKNVAARRAKGRRMEWGRVWASGLIHCFELLYGRLSFKLRYLALLVLTRCTGLGILACKSKHVPGYQN